MIDQILVFPDLIKYLIIFIYNCTCQSSKRSKSFILEKFGIQIFKKIFKILILEHKKIDMVEEEKRMAEQRKRFEEENIMNLNKKQVRVLGDYNSDSDNEMNEGENESEVNMDVQLKKKEKSEGSQGRESENSKKGSISPKSSKNEGLSPTLTNKGSLSPSKSKSKSKNKMSKISLQNLSSQKNSTFLTIQYTSQKNKLNFKSDPNELINPYTIGELDEWFTRWFIHNVNPHCPKNNEHIHLSTEDDQDSVFSLFPRIFNYFMSSFERKHMMHRIEFEHHKGINSIKFIKLDTKRLNNIEDGENDEENEDDIQLYPPYIISVSSSQAQILHFLSDLMSNVFEEKSDGYRDITKFFRNDLCLHLCESFNYLVDNYERHLMNELIIKRCFKNTSRFINEIEYDDYESSDEEELNNEEREFLNAPSDVKECMSKVIKYHSQLIKALVSYVTIFGCVASKGERVDKVRATLTDNKVLSNVMKIIQIIDQITQVLVDNKIVTKNEEPKMPILDMNQNNQRKAVHPLNRFFVKCLICVVNLIPNNPRAVRFYEREKDKFLQLTSHTKGEFCTEAIKDYCLLAIRLLIDQSKDLTQRLEDLSLFEIEEDCKVIFEKFGMNEDKSPRKKK